MTWKKISEIYEKEKKNTRYVFMNTLFTKLFLAPSEKCEHAVRIKLISE